tara:strand:- start:252 stop:1145 length:894 start_codon:yes stop_codon:yes gene_type:complete
MAIVGDIATTTEKPIQTGGESSLSNWAGDYVTGMLGKGQALGNEAYNAYMGPLTAGSSGLQDQAFQGLGNLSLPTDQMGVGGYQQQQFTGDVAQQYMNPYLQQSLTPQLEEARRQAGITAAQNANQFAGAYGGSAQALYNAEASRNLGQNLSAITGQGYADAYDKGLGQFNTAQDRASIGQDKTNLYGMTGLGALAEMGGIQRGIESEGVMADRAQFEEERDFPYKQVQYMQSLLQGLPIAAQSYSYEEPSFLAKLGADASDTEGFLTRLFGGGSSGNNTGNLDVGAKNGNDISGFD